MRACSVVVALAVSLLAASAIAAEVVVEDWKAYKVGTTGLPGAWKPQSDSDDTKSTAESMVGTIRFER